MFSMLNLKLDMTYWTLWIQLVYVTIFVIPWVKSAKSMEMKAQRLQLAKFPLVTLLHSSLKASIIM